MFPNPQDALPLPPRPNVEQYKKIAKELVKACQSDDAAIGQWAARWVQSLVRNSELTLTPAQPVRQDRWVEQVAEFARHKLGGAEGRSCTLADAQFAIARCQGFASWPKFAEHIAALHREGTRTSRFEAAADAIVTGDAAKLKWLLRQDPELQRARSTREHHATLLHYVSANGVEGYRQKTPSNIVEIAKILLDAGAEVDEEADVYGGGATALGLVATSIHPERAGVQSKLMQLLLDHGAVIDHAQGASNHQTLIQACVYNGRLRAAEFLAEHGAHLDLETAAALGQLQVVKSFFDEDGHLKPSATKRQMEQGFTWACLYDRRRVVEFLLDRGVDVSVQGSQGETGLHWAAASGHLDIVKLLLEHKASLETKNVYGGTVLGQTLWSAVNTAQPGVDHLPVIEALLAAGALVDEGTLAWLAEQRGGAAAAKARIGETLRRYGAKS